MIKVLHILLLSILTMLIGCQVSQQVQEEKVVYFEEPTDLSAVVSSAKQDYVIDTLIEDLMNPWGIAFLPNGSVLITERSGKLLLVKDGKIANDSIYGLPEILAKGQGGLLDIRLHPQYEENGWIYFSYSSPGEEEGSSNTAIMRAKLQGDSLLVNQEKLFQALPYSTKGHHFGDRIQFDGKGFMYFTVGDRGDRSNPQNLSVHSGKVLRLHDDGKIPQDNPFVNVDTAMHEIYSYGHRNPQGLVLNTTDGTIWEHEHGPRGGDELNIIEAGKNYGWPVITYGINYDSTIITTDTVMAGMEQPITFWRPSIAPCGMALANSDKYPNWKGNLLVGSLKFRYLNRVEIENGKVVNQEKLIDQIGRVRAVEEAPDGYIYAALESPGMIVRLYPINEENTTPEQ
ncbi:PQQ-dependent sugar dehydrogenase [Flexithrix dorotheae]|uniref:PQQ-dependent sugar dehydrogenase n=1 Tax=Flexithrix dorotheae TaxID=70993 RepID=UPI00146A0B64|nr:PQQ-dependent sugar dehydrogenase [Flexithrix dorotheae]